MSDDEINIIDAVKVRIKDFKKARRRNPICVRDRAELIRHLDALLLDERVAIAEYREFGAKIPVRIEENGKRDDSNTGSVIIRELVKLSDHIEDDERVHRDNLKKLRDIIIDTPDCK